MGKGSNVVRHLQENPRELGPDEIRLEGGGSLMLHPAVPRIDVDPSLSAEQLLDRLSGERVGMLALRHPGGAIEAVVMPVRDYLEMAPDRIRAPVGQEATHPPEQLPPAAGA